MGLTSQQADIIKATVPVLEQHGLAITTTFYKNMLDEHTELHGMFNTANQVTQHQQKALAGALYAYAANIDNLAALNDTVELITQRHASLYIRPDHYKIVGTYLLAAMKIVLGDALTPEIHDAWAAAYWLLADLLIEKEASLYRSAGDWNDWREFKIEKKVPESDEITSFYLKPVDGKPLPSFRPGQYISVMVDVPALNYPQARQYSLSDMPRPDYYRISVKKETGVNPSNPQAAGHPGYISNILHDIKKEGDVVLVSHPYGDFYLADFDGEKATSKNPIVLISAGVGLTPLTSILNTITSKSGQTDRKVHFVHGVRRGSARAFKDHIQNTAKAHSNLKVTFFNSLPSSTEKQGVDYHHAERVNLHKLDRNNDLFLDDKTTEYYLCGPESFMTAMKKQLLELGVEPARIKLELFGTGGVPAS
ncbi:hypothetical protein DTO027B5_787 [Paecilomyces variotii]|nr:hypothetical protein DTO169C6_427 [Paecilomyces variotii]KAJ9290009.1 hypothetical protein DTO021C3_2367 [Paecilomyces variotii]KAJ9329605.1 hypothetical protein DTO027B3_92 [Paecilomyces variotii]KAJ9337438.1 hypothetical protein DTO027B5_787 [Paecilomyces variotii]